MKKIVDNCIGTFGLGSSFFATITPPLSLWVKIAVGFDRLSRDTIDSYSYGSREDTTSDGQERKSEPELLHSGVRKESLSSLEVD
jgi:hypothetical protein